MTRNAKSVMLGGIAVASWATVATAFKIALQYLTVYNMLLVASLTATLLYVAMMTIERKWGGLRHLPRKVVGEAMAIGLINPTVYYLALFKSYDMLPAQVAQPINYVWPVFLVVMLAVFNHEKIPAKKYIGMAISVGGVVCISLGGGGVEGALSASGIAIDLLSAFLWAVYWMVNDRLKSKVDTTTALFLGFAAGSTVLLAGGLLSGAIDISSRAGLLSGIYIGFFEMGIPFLTFGMALRTTSNPALINQMCYLAPFLSLFFISLILAEKIAPATYAGLVLIVAGILYNQYRVKG